MTYESYSNNTYDILLSFNNNYIQNVVFNNSDSQEEDLPYGYTIQNINFIYNNKNYNLI